MPIFTVNKARKILGKIANNISDEELEKDIKTAEILKVIFFNNYRPQKKSQQVYTPKENGKA
ncbi:MAG TPA: hypothetical protein VJG66_02870 [Patescibacteria group bacterium]|nr:hypothetical protein [Patescibacteria group bacterium]